MPRISSIQPTMMLTTSYNLPTPQHYTVYSPPRPSPLSERSVNATPRMFNFTMAAQANEKKTPMSQRAYKPNPVIQTRDAATKRRRDMFFRRVQDNREDKKWAARGEQIQQLDFMAERKRWEAEKARQAPAEEIFIDEDILEDAALPVLPTYGSQHEAELTEAEHIAAQEEYELRQLIASMEQDADARSQNYGSDDDDYDSIFMECTSAADLQYQSQAPFGYGGTDAMDMDMTDA